MKTGLEETQKLNEKYGENKFFFLYRKRTWNECEQAYIGWERKRGLLSTFNKYIKGKIENNFLANTINLKNKKIPEIKYIITLDSDTNLNLESASKLVGAMSHILNLPIVENEKVIDGYGIMQPRIGLDLSLAHKTSFVELFSMQGGIDCYTNAISDIYQDYFEEGIFTGKGIYDVDIYNEICYYQNTTSFNKEYKLLIFEILQGDFI